ncbi:hypothetical protein C0995_008497 [Termitomyces sp. Mi166|nr:hypothetical protein C0995_008497 [Termitomyces sp. Mi166\
MPIAKTLSYHISLALEVSRNDLWTIRNWWDWYGSWIFFGGPLGRWFWIVLGFRILRSWSGPDYSLPGEFIEKPHLRLLVLILCAALISAFALGLGITTTRAILLGTTSVETLGQRVVLEGQTPLKPPITLVCIPDTGSRRVYEIPRGEKIYDLGIKRNWWLLLKAPLYPTESRLISVQSIYSWPKINPVILQRLRKREGFRAHDVSHCKPSIKARSLP